MKHARRIKDFDNRLHAVLFWIACAAAGFCIPTAICGWLGMLDPLFK
jgi:hypothetical protein